MSRLGRLMALFPALVVLLAAGCLWVAPPAAPLVVYLLPPLVYRLHSWRFPLKEGLSRLVGADYAPWWGGHQVQLLFIAVPSLEAILRICGVYSPWLRLWGATVGRGVYWTPLVEITDRALLDIGDDVVIGHKCGFYGHAIKPAKDNLILYTKRIRIGKGAFLSGGCGFGPGAEVAEGAYLPLRTEVYPNRRFSAGEGGAGQPLPSKGGGNP